MQSTFDGAVERLQQLYSFSTLGVDIPNSSTVFQLLIAGSVGKVGAFGKSNVRNPWKLDSVYKAKTHSLYLEQKSEKQIIEALGEMIDQNSNNLTEDLVVEYLLHHLRAGLLREAFEKAINLSSNMLFDNSLIVFGNTALLAKLMYESTLDQSYLNQAVKLFEKCLSINRHPLLLTEFVKMLLKAKQNSKILGILTNDYYSNRILVDFAKELKPDPLVLYNASTLVFETDPTHLPSIDIIVNYLQNTKNLVELCLKLFKIVEINPDYYKMWKLLVDLLKNQSVLKEIQANEAVKDTIKYWPFTVTSIKSQTRIKAIVTSSHDHSQQEAH